MRQTHKNKHRLLFSHVTLRTPIFSSVNTPENVADMILVHWRTAVRYEQCQRRDKFVKNITDFRVNRTNQPATCVCEKLSTWTKGALSLSHPLPLSLPHRPGTIIDPPPSILFHYPLCLSPPFPLYIHFATWLFQGYVVTRRNTSNPKYILLITPFKTSTTKKKKAQCITSHLFHFTEKNGASLMLERYSYIEEYRRKSVYLYNLSSSLLKFLLPGGVLGNKTANWVSSLPGSVSTLRGLAFSLKGMGFRSFRMVL